MEQKELTQKDKEVLYAGTSNILETILDIDVNLLKMVKDCYDKPTKDQSNQKDILLKDDFKQCFTYALSKVIFNSLTKDDEYVASLDLTSHMYAILESNNIVKICDLISFIADLLNDVTKWTNLIDYMFNVEYDYNTPSPTYLDVCSISTLPQIIFTLPKYRAISVTIEELLKQPTYKPGMLGIMRNCELSTSMIVTLRKTVGNDICELHMKVGLDVRLVFNPFTNNTLIARNNGIEFSDIIVHKPEQIDRLDIMYLIFNIYKHVGMPMNILNLGFIYSELNIVWSNIKEYIQPYHK